MRPCDPTTLGASVANGDTPATYGGAAQGRLAGCQRPLKKAVRQMANDPDPNAVPKWCKKPIFAAIIPKMGLIDVNLAAKP